MIARVRSLSWEEVWGRRLARHFLLDPAPPRQLVGVAGAICGVHAQLMPSAEVALGLRVAGATRADLRAELWDRRGLVKTYGPRGTLHLFPAGEIQLWLAALRAAPERTDLPPSQLDALVAAIAAALDGHALTRDELGAEVAARVGPWALRPGQQAFGGRPARWTMAIGPAARAGVICFGPGQGNKVRYVRLDQWLPAGSTMDTETALAEVLRRFLAGYGPATPREFARWFYLDEKRATRLFESAGDLEPVDVAGWRAWALADRDPAPAAAGTVRLLPHFDSYVVGAHPRQRFIPPEWTARGLTRGTASTLPVLLLDGVVAGVWQRRGTASRLDITVDPFTPLTAGQRDRVAAEAARIATILEARTHTIHFGPTAARPHL